MSKKTPLLDRASAPIVAIVSVAVAVIAGVLCWWQIVHYEDNLVDIFAEQQDQYVQLAVDQIKASDSDDADAVENVLSSIAGSNSHYWTLSRDGDFVFVKDVTDSNRYRGLPDSTYFDTDDAKAFVDGLVGNVVSHAVVSIDDRQFIASGTEFSHGGNSYRICLLTGKNVVIDHNAYLAARVNLATTIAIALASFAVFAIAMAMHNDRKRRRESLADEEMARLRENVERLGDRLMGRASDGSDGKDAPAAFAMTPLALSGAAAASSATADCAEQLSEGTEMTEKTRIRRIYCFKFYLNASHYVYFGGAQGETHPHTWEFSLKLEVDGCSLQQFSDYEKVLGAVFEPYQNKTVNEIAPFDELLPTLENIVEVFGAASRDAARKVDARLLEFEGSETPTRSYLVSYE